MDFSIILKNGTKLRGLFSVPSDNPRALIVLVHGIGEHINRYKHVAGYFSSIGVGLIGVDLPGHGKSDGKRGHISGFALYREMIDTITGISGKTYPGVPLFIYGHSLGGGIVLEYLIHSKRKYRGAIVTSPWLRLAFEPSKAKRSIASVVKKILPSLLQPTGLDINHLSHDNEVVEAYGNDPLVHDKISVNLFQEAMEAGEFSLANAALLTIPVLLMHGSMDMITSPEASREFASKAANAEFKIWEGGYHELHNEIFKNEVMEYMGDWINIQLNSK